MIGAIFSPITGIIVLIQMQGCKYLMFRAIKNLQFNIAGVIARHLNPKKDFSLGMVWKLNKDTELRVQHLFVESYRETGMGSQGLC